MNMNTQRNSTKTHEKINMPLLGQQPTASTTTTTNSTPSDIAELLKHFQEENAALKFQIEQLKHFIETKEKIHDKNLSRDRYALPVKNRYNDLPMEEEIHTDHEEAQEEVEEEPFQEVQNKRRKRKNNEQNENDARNHAQQTHQINRSNIGIDTNATTTPNTDQKLPPIVIKSKIINYKQFHQKIITTTAQTPTIFYGNRTKIFVKSDNDYKKLINLFDHQQLEYFSYRKLTEATKSLVIKTVPFLEEEELTKFYKQQHPGVLYVRKMKSKKDDLESRSYLIKLTSETNINDIKKIKSIDGAFIHYERYIKPTKITMCRRCQEFGHGTENCRSAPRCVKCPKNHLTQDCDKEPDAPPICTNCTGPHPANFTGCPAYNRYVQQKHIKVADVRTPNLTINDKTFPLPKPYYKATPSIAQNSSPKNTHTNNTNTTPNTHHPMQSYINILQKFQKIKPEIDNAPTEVEKLIVILKHYGS